MQQGSFQTHKLFGYDIPGGQGRYIPNLEPDLTFKSTTPEKQYKRQGN